MNNRPGKGITKRFSKGLDEANTARSSLRSTEKILATQRSSSIQVKLDDDLQSLATGLNKLDGPGADKEAVSQQLAAVQQQVEQVGGENDELRTFFQEALQEAERLKHENEELRKLGEDAVLDQQLSKALQETDKLKLAADAYKKELLQQKVSELQAELTQTSKRLKKAEEENTGLNQALQGAKGGRRDSFRRLDKRASQQSLDGLAEDHSAKTASLQSNSGERQALLARLQGPQQNRGDLDELLAAATRVLQDAETLAAQLAEARNSNTQLQGEVEKLNDTVFSKTFRAPSAWAEREVKYKMEKKDWDTQVERLQGAISKLNAENVQYRDNNKTQQFETRIQELEQKLQQTEGAKVTAERAVHELQLDMRSQIEKYDQLQEARKTLAERHMQSRHHEARTEDGVSSMIEGFDRQLIGGVHPHRPQTKAILKQAIQAQEPDAVSGVQTKDELGEAGTHTHVQDVVSDFDTHHIGLQQPHTTPQDEPDTHLHNQLAPDVIGQQPSSTYIATEDTGQSPSSSHQLATQLPSSTNSAGHDQSAKQSTLQREGDLEASSSQSRQQFNQSGTAVFPPQQTGQMHSSTGVQSSSQAAPEQHEEESVIGAQQAANAYQQQHPAGAVTPDQPLSSDQPQPQQQPAIDASAEVTSFIPSDTPNTAHVSTATSSSLQQQPARSDQDAEAASIQQQQAETTGGTMSEDVQTPVLQPQKHGATASDAQQLQPAESAVQDSDSQLLGVVEQQLEAASSVSDARPNAAQAPEAAISASDIRPGAAQAPGPAALSDVQQKKPDAQAEDRGAGFPAGPLDDESDGLSESEDELLTVKDAVTHIARSTRQSRANSSDRLDQLGAEQASIREQSQPQPAAESTPKVTFQDAGHISLAATSSLPPLATQRPPGNSRETNDMNGAITERSECSEAWSEERIRQLEEDKAAIERLWGEHAQENDIGVLKFKLAEFESRCEMYEAQVTKMQRSLERGDDEKAKIEQQLHKAMALTAQGDKQGLAALRERLSMVVTGRASKTAQLEERLKEAEEQLQQSFRERARLEKQRSKLEHQLASWSSKTGVSIDLPRADSVDTSEPSGSDKGERVLKHWQSSGSNIAGLNDGEMEVMRLREENEALMDSLVRTKVELAETEGEYLKTKRSLIRANEKLAGLSERVESLKQALNRAGVHNSSDSPSARSDTSTQPFGTPKSTQAGTPKTDNASMRF